MKRAKVAGLTRAQVSHNTLQVSTLMSLTDVTSMYMSGGRYNDPQYDNAPMPQYDNPPMPQYDNAPMPRASSSTNPHYFPQPQPDLFRFDDDRSAFYEGNTHVHGTPLPPWVGETPDGGAAMVDRGNGFVPPATNLALIRQGEIPRDEVVHVSLFFLVCTIETNCDID